MRKSILILISAFLLSALFACNTGTDESSNDKSNTADSKEQLVEASFDVLGTCGMCKDRIEEAATGINGVESATWNKDTKVLSLTYTTGLNLDKVHQAIADVGHDTNKIKAKDEVYETLPGCCRYREGAEMR